MSQQLRPPSEEHRQAVSPPVERPESPARSLTEAQAADRRYRQEQRHRYYRWKAAGWSLGIGGLLVFIAACWQSTVQPQAPVMHVFGLSWALWALSDWLSAKTESRFGVAAHLADKEDPASVDDLHHLGG